MRDELPHGWASLRLDELVCSRKGKKPNASRPEASKGFVPYLDIQAIEKGDISSYAEAVSSRLGTNEDVFVVWDGARSGWAGLGREGAIGSTIMALQPKAGDRRYIYRWLQSQFQHINTNTRGTGIPHVDPEVFWNLEIPLAPFAEQRRIVAKLTELLGKVDACQQRLAKIPVLLKRFRQSVLAAACSGRLTADWREEKGIKHEAKTDLESYLALTKSLRPRTREAEPTEGHELLTDDTPSEWEMPPLDEVFRFIDYRGKTPKKSSNGKRLISAKNIKMGYISEEPVEYVSNDFYRKWMTRGFPKVGDIFFVTEGHTMGFAALNNRTDEFALSQRTITLQPWQPIETRALFYFILSPTFQKVVALNATGSAAVGIKAAKFRGLPIPFPSLAEQQEIVRRVEGLFALADQIEARFTQARAQVDKLTPSLLARAFRGQLVPQDPTDEPAEKLLERIRRNGESKA